MSFVDILSGSFVSSPSSHSRLRWPFSAVTESLPEVRIDCHSVQGSGSHRL